MLSLPTLFWGALLLIPPHRVHIVDVPFTQAFSAMAKWGTGMRDIAPLVEKRLTRDVAP